CDGRKRAQLFAQRKDLRRRLQARTEPVVDAARPGGEVGIFPAEALGIAVVHRIELPQALVDADDVGGDREAKSRARRAQGEIQVVEMETVEGLVVETDATRDLSMHREENAVNRLDPANRAALEADHCELE